MLFDGQPEKPWGDAPAITSSSSSAVTWMLRASRKVQHMSGLMMDGPRGVLRTGWEAMSVTTNRVWLGLQGSPAHCR